MPHCPRLMICEGYEDVQFFKNLIQIRGLPEFRVIDTSGDNDRQGGITKFDRAINAFKVKNPNRFKVLSHIVIVADNDRTPADNFALVKGQIEKIFPNASPDAPLERSRSRPYVSVLMIPWTDEVGNIEKLCHQALRSSDTNIAVNVDTFMANIRADRWGDECRQSKAWLRSNIAARATDPGCPLGNVFERGANLIDYNHRSFNQIADFLRGLA